MWLFLFVAAVAWALVQAGVFQNELVNEGGWTLVVRFIEAALSPDLSPEFLSLTLAATLTTLAFAVTGSFLSLILGLIGGILASEVWWESLFPKRNASHRLAAFRAPWLAVRSVLAVLRAIHEIIWGLFFVNVIGLDPLTAILAIAIPFGAVTAKVFADILDETPRQPFIALQNSGVSPLKAFAYSLLPQAFLNGLSYGFYRFECSIRAAAVLGIIGAGGLGYEIFLSLQSLRYEQIWTLFLALFTLNGLADFWSALLRRRFGAKTTCGATACLDVEVIKYASARLSASAQQRDWVINGSLLIVAFLVPFSFWYVSPDIGQLFSLRAWYHLTEVVRFSLPLNFEAFQVGEWLELAAITIAMSLLATAAAGVFGLILAYPAANNFLLPEGKLYQYSGTLILILTRGLLLVARSIPPPIWALLMLFVLFPGILPGAAALGIYTMGVLGWLMAQVAENLDDRPLAALKAQGASGGQVFAYAVLPLTMPHFISYLLYRWEETIRATVVIGLVGAGGLGRLLTEQLSAFDYRGVLTTLVVFISLIFLADLMSAAARRAYREA